MNFDITENLKKEDIDILKLRHLYSQFGYVHFKMNKFEEYDLYVANKDFLSSGNIIRVTKRGYTGYVISGYFEDG